MQTILGSGGAIGIELAKALPKYTDKIRLVSRDPQIVNDSDELLKADLLNKEQVIKAVEGSDVVYLTVGLQYNVKVWQEQWPIVMKNAIAACKEHNSKLVFFDNIYMYDPNYISPATENSPVGPASKKGKVRKEIAEMFLREVERGELVGLIARCADFYGPNINQNSVLTEMVFMNLYSGKKANWLGSAKFKHSFTYTPDAGKATALLGNTDSTYGEVWHLPTATDPFTGEEWINNIAKELGVEPKYQVAPKLLVRIMGLFVPVMKEIVEMMYQYDRDYIFDSSKFENRFNFTPTPYLEGIKEIVDLQFKK